MTYFMNCLNRSNKTFLFYLIVFVLSATPCFVLLVVFTHHILFLSSDARNIHSYYYTYGRWFLIYHNSLEIT